MRLLQRVKKILDRSLETLVIVVVAVLVLDVLWQVFTRLIAPLGRWLSSRRLDGLWQVFTWLIPKNPSTWTEELATFMLVWVALLGAAVALNRGAHLGIDYFVGKLPQKAKLVTETIVFFCVAAFSFSVMVVGGMDLVLINLDLGQESPALRLKVGYVYLAVPISGFFLTLYAVIGLVERLARWRTGSTSANPRAEVRDPLS